MIFVHRYLKNVHVEMLMFRTGWLTWSDFELYPVEIIYCRMSSKLCAVFCHYNDNIMSAMASKITSLTIVYSTVYLGTDRKKHHSSASLAFVRGIHRWPVNSPHKWPVTRKIFPFDDVIGRLNCIYIIWILLYLIHWNVEVAIHAEISLTLTFE